MSQVIRISNELYNRLKRHADGFDTPANVIERVLDIYENKSSNPVVTELIEANSLDIMYSGMSENQFKQELLEHKQCDITLSFTNGSNQSKHWNASNFTQNSNLVGNLRSGFLRDWRQRGIFKAELSFNEIN